MATRRRKQTLSKKTTPNPQTNDEEDNTEVKVKVLFNHPKKQQTKGVRGEEEEFVDVTNTSEQGSSTSRASPGPANNMSLDVLAQVATATLHNNQTTSDSASQKKLTKRSVQSLDVLNLDQIRMLSDKALVHMFSEMTANEMTRNYTYTCFLVPDKCQATFTSFGNESRARMRLRAHLLEHIGELLQEENAPEKSQPFKFSAEPVSARKRRIAALMKKYNKKNGQGSPAKGKSKLLSTIKQEDQDSQYTVIKAANPEKEETEAKVQFVTFTDFLESVGNEETTAVDTVNPADKSLSEHLISNVQSPKTNKRITTSPKAVQKQNKSATRNSPRKKDFESPKKVVVEQCQPTPGIEAIYFDDGHNLGHVQSEEPNIEPIVTEVIVESTAMSEEMTQQSMEDGQQFIIELLGRQQPHHDHSYTSIFGKKGGIETMHHDIETSEEESSEENDLSNAPGVVQVGSSVVKLLMGMDGVITIAPTQTVTSMDGLDPVIEETIENHQVGEFVAKKGQRIFKSHGHYPPMPKSELADNFKGRVSVAEEAVSTSEEDDDVLDAAQWKRPLEGSAEWERKMALKCIRELKLKKKDDRAPLLCKICRDKTFTATATLMYHYRSHAGIKPFVCLICNTTFTRQHSLNYHMLIHNNQSRFTCKDCGRKFRHPSHFKEHLRRHTGETPFHCTDCPLKFKTRNTYKRHLKTRHGKLLTATGIHRMPADDFEKVRTKIFRRDYNEGQVDSGEEYVIAEGIQAETPSAHQMSPPLTILAPPANPLMQFCTQVVGHEITL